MVLRKRGKRWLVDGYVEGRRLVTSFQTKAEAEAFKREFRFRECANKLKSALGPQVGLKEAINKYFKLVSSQKSEATQKNEKRFFETLYNYFGDVRMCDVTLLRLEEFREILKKQVTAASINRMFNTFRHFFKRCMDWQLVERNPTVGLSNLKVDEKPKTLWTDAQIEQVLGRATPWAADAFYFLALTAARAGEVARLKWADIDLGESAAVTLRSRKGNGEWRTRRVPLVGKLREFVERKRNEAIREFRARPQEEVFRNASGNPVTMLHLSREMRRLTRVLKFQGLTLHGLRHTFLTRMVERDLSLEKVRLIAGHSNLKTTQQYLHTSDEVLADAMDAAVGARVIRLPVVTSGNK